MIHRRWQVVKEPIEELEIGGIKGRSAQRVDLVRGTLETLWIPTREDHLGAFSACTSGRFKSYTGATADHNDSLPEEFRLALDPRSQDCGAHDSSISKSELPGAPPSAAVLTITVRNG
jgi:hypothetical protein